MSGRVGRRPYMPGYGISTDAEGLLPWSWAEERLTRSRDYWLATTWPDGEPHVMPVWGVWLDEALWFSTEQQSRKGKNLAQGPRCVLTTDNTREPVVVRGRASLLTDRADVVRYRDALKVKHAHEWREDRYAVDLFDANLGGGGTYRVEPTSVFALYEPEFGSSPTLWSFDDCSR